MALREFLILRKPRSGCLEGRSALIQPIDNSFTGSQGEAGLRIKYLILRSAPAERVSKDAKPPVFPPPSAAF